MSSPAVVSRPPSFPSNHSRSAGVSARDAAGLAAAITRLAVDPAERSAFGEAGRIRMLAEFDEERVVERTLEVYRRLLARSRR